jgi:hypothetical protein
MLAYGDWVEQNVLPPVPHWQSAFTVPRILRPSFAHRRKLLVKLCHIAERLLAQACAGAAKEIATPNGRTPAAMRVPIIQFSFCGLAVCRMETSWDERGFVIESSRTRPTFGNVKGDFQ